MKFNILFLTIILSVTHCIDCSKILGIFPIVSHSHYTIGLRLFQELAARGHDVTVISGIPPEKPVKNLRYVVVDSMDSKMDELKKGLFDMEGLYSTANILLCYNMGNFIVESTFASEGVHELLKSGETFDLVITEEFHIPALSALATYFNASSIFLSPLRSNTWSNSYFGNPDEPAYVPHILSRFDAPMNFLERVENAFLFIYDSIYKHFSFLPEQNRILHKFFPDMPHLDQIIYNHSLMLVNTDVSIHDSIPMVPNIIPIGGFHVLPPKPLPDDIQKFLDEATEGAIFFSLGSNLKSADMPVEKINATLAALSKIKQRVIWKFEASLPNAPSNMKIGKWFPQSDILAHPNIRAFISHGGGLSTIESVNRGVPIVGIPVFGDQKMNMRSAVHKGYAVQIPYRELTEEKLTWALSEILTNPKYTINVKQRSQLMRDKPIKPMDLAIFWVEHVIRNGGSPHMKSPAVNLNWYQRWMLDVALFVALICYVVFVFIKMLILDFVVLKKDSNRSAFYNNKKKAH